MNDVFALALVAWLVYLWDALWWVGPESVILRGRQLSDMRVSRGPSWALRGDAGVFLPRLIPPFEYHLEVQPPAGVRPVDDAAIVSAAGTALTAARPLLWLGSALWVFCFIAAPALLMSFGLRRVWIALAVGLFGGAMVIVAVFARAWKRVYPRDRRGWRSHAFPMILSPLGAICAADVLTRSACASFGGLAVAAALARQDEFIRLARLCYFPAASNYELERILAAKGLTAALFVPPVLSDPGMRAFCPRCHAQLSRTQGMCPDCGDVPLRSLGREVSGVLDAGSRKLEAGS